MFNLKTSFFRNAARLGAITMCAAMLGTFSGCDDKEKQPEIKVENETALTQTVYADQTAGKSGVTFVTAGAWTSTITEGTAKSTKSGTLSWISISPDRGNAAGTYTVTISLEPNATGADRGATIAITCNGEDIVITVTQKATRQQDGSIPAGSVSLNKPSLTLEAGNKETLTATVLPENATNKNVTWTSSNENVATVSATGEVTAVAVGNATITTKTVDGNKKADCDVTVTGITVERISMKSLMLLEMGGKETLSYSIVPENASNKAVTWKSSNESVATVNATGEVTAKAIGNAEITITTQDGGKTATCNVQVVNQLRKMTLTVNLLNPAWTVQLNVSSSGLVNVDWGDGIVWTRTGGVLQLFGRAYGGSTAVRTITISGESITELIYNANQNNPLTSLDVSKNAELEWLNCSGNQLASLDLSKNIQLKYLWCSSNQLTSLDLSKNTALLNLVCAGNQLTSINLSGCSELMRLDCSDNLLESLNLSTNTNLYDALKCQNNLFTAAGLNALFGTLHSNNNWEKTIYIGGNPGTGSCNQSIATNKGWIVDDVL